MELQAEIKKELRDGFTWGGQTSNVISSLAWLFGTWIWMTTLALGAVTGAVFLTWEPGFEMTFAELQSAFGYLLAMVGLITLFTLIVFGLPKRLRNVFRDVAQNRIDREKAIKEKVMSQIETTEALLVGYGLISREDVDARKSTLTNDRLI